jgi:hypothetical protein
VSSSSDDCRMTKMTMIMRMLKMRNDAKRMESRVGSQDDDDDDDD